MSRVFGTRTNQYRFVCYLGFHVWHAGVFVAIVGAKFMPTINTVDHDPSIKSQRTFTHLTFRPYEVYIWSLNPPNLEAAKCMPTINTLLFFFFSLLLSSLELSDTKVYEP